MAVSMNAIWPDLSLNSSPKVEKYMSLFENHLNKPGVFTRERN